MVDIPERLECPNCQITLRESWVANTERFLTLRYRCPKCPYLTLRHIEHPKLDPNPPALSVLDRIKAMVSG
jgi:hypothetical protein